MRFVIEILKRKLIACGVFSDYCALIVIYE